MKCKLCHKEAELRESHIIPSFFFRYLKSSSGTGHLRSQQTANKRVQDGYKEYWLCQSCEDQFNKFETLFSNNIFHRLTKQNAYQFTYDQFLLKFCASVSWRVLTYLKEKEGLSHLPEKIQEESEKFLNHLRLFLLGQKESPGKYEQHILLLDLVEDHSVPDMPTNINRYFLRNIDIEMPSSKNECVVYTKLPYMVIFGFVYNEKKNTENEISDNQKLRIHKDWNNNKDKVLQSDTYKALNGDISLFGIRAYD
jgi:hypothetical protein